ncbi:MAG TPA: hypothetical protein VFN97_18295 [Actinospica sp.]|nr:hypothetical protein [Actinospica sp.]
MSSNADGATLTLQGGDEYIMFEASGQEYGYIGGELGLASFAQSVTWSNPAPADWTPAVVG